MPILLLLQMKLELRKSLSPSLAEQREDILAPSSAAADSSYSSGVISQAVCLVTRPAVTASIGDQTSGSSNDPIVWGTLHLVIIISF